MSKFVPAVKMVLAALLLGAAKLLGIKWNPWVAGSRDNQNEKEVK